MGHKQVNSFHVLTDVIVQFILTFTNEGMGINCKHNCFYGPILNTIHLIVFDNTSEPGILYYCTSKYCNKNIN